ncbi:nucleotide-diphospho-sugar transferase [Syncephalis plumigaleata]|nr:nucleotide-diphospho-sugar transferase [Syncephalis plumigaleata]
MLFLADDEKTTTRISRSTELQAVVLAGYGNRLGALTEEENLPKALLPVANRPMIAHVIAWVQRCGIHDITVITPNIAVPRVSHTVRTVVEDATSVDIISSDDCQGSADALRLVRDRIKGDVLVVGCDLITEVDPNHLLDFYRLHSDAAVTTMFYEQADTAVVAKEDDFARFVGVTSQQQLVHLSTAEESRTEMQVRATMMWKYPRVRLHANLLDAHVYIFKRWVLDYLADQPRIISLREDLLPALVKMQWKRGRAEREGVLELASAMPSDALLTADEKIALQLSSTVYPQDIDDKSANISCYAIVCRTSTCMTGRANTISAYSELNRHMTRIYAAHHGAARVHASAEVDAKTQVGPDSLVGEGTRVDERCSVKRSVIGAHCQIGKNVKIVNSILMDNVSLGDNVKLDGCVVCQNGKVLERASLKDCTVGAHVIVPSETQAKGEQFRRDLVD